MKKLIRLVIVAAIVLAACGVAPAGEAKTESRFYGGYNPDSLYVSTDRETGCKYIVLSDYRAGGITPLMLPDGTQDCGK